MRRLLARHREVAGRGEAAVEGGRRRRAQLRAAQPQCRPAVQICRHLADRRVEQDRAQGHAEGGADRPVVRRMRNGDFDVVVEATCHGVVNPLLDVQKFLPHRSTPRITGITKTRRRSSSTNKMLHETDPAQAARADARSSRNTCSTPGARDRGAVVVPDRAVPLLCQRLEDQPEPLHQPGPGDGLARQMTEPCRRSRPADLAPDDAGKAGAGSADAYKRMRPGHRDGRLSRMVFAHPLRVAVAAAACPALPRCRVADETPKRGGTLTYMIPADAPPSFDGHRESTFATIHSAAPFYSVLIRVNPENPARPPISSAICAPRCRSRPTAARPTPSRSATGVKFHDGSPLTAADVAASWNADHLPAEGRDQRPRQSYLRDGRQGRGARTRRPSCSA